MNNFILNQSIQSSLNKAFQSIGLENEEFSLDQYKKLKSKNSGAELASKLGLNEHMLTEFEEAIKQFYTHKDNPEKNRLSCLRAGLWLETVTKNLNIPFEFESALSTEDQAIKQVRALELIIRDVITEQLGGTENVILKLQELFKQDVIDKWLKSADNTGILSGTTFSELSNVFLDKNIFKTFEEIFQSSSIELTKSTRESIRYILEDIRVIRNAIAHNKKVSKVQIEALNEYYKAIADILSKANKTQVNPENYLDLSKSNMEAYLNSLKEDNKEISTSINQIKETVTDIKTDTTEILQDSKDNKKRNLLIIVGVVVLILIGLSTLFLQQKQTSNTAEMGNDLKEVKTLLKDDLTDIDSRITEIENKISAGSKVSNPKTLDDYLINSILSYNENDYKTSELMLEKVFKEGYVKYDLVYKYYDVLYNNYNGDIDLINNKIGRSVLNNNQLLKLVELDYNYSGVEYYVKLDKININDPFLKAYIENKKAANFYVDVQKYAEKMTPLMAYWGSTFEKNEKQMGRRIIKCKKLFFDYNKTVKSYFEGASATKDENYIWKFYSTSFDSQAIKDGKSVWKKLVKNQ
jgi:phosphoglycolate phosphatase-like HAD superfamily hydrolase